MNKTERYRIVDKHPAYEVWEDETMLSRHPNKSEAANAKKRYEAADKRRERSK